MLTSGVKLNEKSSDKNDIIIGLKNFILQRIVGTQKYA